MQLVKARRYEKSQSILTQGRPLWEHTLLRSKVQHGKGDGDDGDGYDPNTVKAEGLNFKLSHRKRFERDEMAKDAEEKSENILLEMLNEGNDSSDDIVDSACVEVMLQLAKLGKADAAQTFYQTTVDRHGPAMSRQTNMTMLRCLLYSWSNQVQLLPRNSAVAMDAARQAAAILDRILKLGLETEKGTEVELELDGADVEVVIKNYLFLQPPKIDAVYGVWKVWQEHVSRLGHPSLLLSARIIRNIANVECTNWGVTLQNSKISKAVGDAAISHFSNSNHPQEDGNPEEDILTVYNALLEVWSKALPPPAKQSKSSHFNVLHDERQIVGQRTKQLLDEMGSSGIKPNFQTYATILYAYCKAGWLEEAWVLWKVWKEEMLSLDPAFVTKIDGRCLPMLIQSTVRFVQEHVEEDAKPGWTPIDFSRLATEALYDMWTLHDLGFNDLEPNLALYISLLCCWANPHFDSEAMQNAKFIVQDLNNRHKKMLPWNSLQPNMTFYNAWMGVVRSQFGCTQVTLSGEAGLIVKHMEQQSMDNPTVAPDTSVYNFLVDACLSDGSLVGVERGEKTLIKMMEVSTAVSSSKRLSPNGRSFASIIRAWKKFDTSKAEYWLDKMEERFIPASTLFEELILQCCEETKVQPAPKRRQQAERAKRLLNRMSELRKVTSNQNLQPDRSLYSNAIEAWERCDVDEQTESEINKLRDSQNDLLYDNTSDKGGQRQFNSDKDVFQAMVEFGGSFNGNYQPDADTYIFNRIIGHIAKTEKVNAGQIAEEIFVYMLEQKYINNADVKLRPDLITFNSVLLAWSRSSHPEAAIRAHAFLDNLKGLHEGGMLLEVHADRISYNTVISAYQRHGAPEEAERVFNSLQNMYESTQDKNYLPDTVSICSLLGAYAKAGNAHKAEKLLLGFYESRKMNLSSSCFDQTLLAWAKQGTERGTERAEMLLKLMEDMSSSPGSNLSPTTATYNIVIHALSNSGDLRAPRRAQMLLERMKSGKLGKKVRPDTVTYTTTISLVCRLGGRDAIQTTKQLLEEAMDAPNVKVDAAFFGNMLSSLATCSQEEMVQFAEELVEKRMPELGIKTTIYVFNALLNCYAKRGKGEEAEGVLVNFLESELVHPNSQSYTIVLDAYAKSQSLTSMERAEDIMQRMQSSSSCKPDVKSYTALIQKYARSNVPLKAKRAQAVLHSMTKEGSRAIRPTVVTYNALLNACEYTNSTDLMEKEEAFTVACLTFDEIRKLPDIDPSHITYGSFLGSVTALMPRSDARNEIAELVFKRCCKDGQVSQYVLRKLSAAVSLSRYRQMLGGNKEDTLPRRWTANVRERKRERSAVQRKPTPRNKVSYAIQN